MLLAGSIISPASEFYLVIKLSATVITLVKVSIEYAEDCSGDIKAWELSYFKDFYFRKVGVFHLICHVWLPTRQELDEMVERDVIGG